MPADISIIIVNYNTGDLLFKCLDSLRKNLDCNWEAVVADNDSPDDSFSVCEKEFAGDSRFKFIRVGYNSGFSKANNIAAKAASGRILHFLNPDTEVAPSLADDYAVVLQNPVSVYVNPLFNKDGSLENDRMPVPSLRDIFYWNLRRDKARVWYKGASVIISAENFASIGGWSEDYFLYAEDLDFFYKAAIAGIGIEVLSSGIFHLGKGSSSRSMDSLGREVMVQKSTRIFFGKYFSGTEYFFVKLYYLLHNLLKHPSAVPLYLKAWRLSGKREKTTDR